MCLRLCAVCFALLVLAAAAVFWMSEYVRCCGEELLQAGSNVADGNSARPITAIVPGAAVWPGDIPSHMLEDRVLTAVWMYHEGKASRLFMSGNRDGGYNEPDVMARLAVSKGVPQEAILLDYAGYTTRMTMQNAARIFGIGDAVVVTQGYHLPRALYLGDKAGMRVTGKAADLRRYQDIHWDRFREFFARTKAYM
jgi:SanA protein